MFGIAGKYLLKHVLMGMALSTLIILGFIITATWFRMSAELSFSQKLLELVGINLLVIHLLVPLITFLGVAIGLGRLLVNRELISIHSTVRGRRLILAMIALPVVMITIMQTLVFDQPSVKQLYLAERGFEAEQTHLWYRFDQQFFWVRETDPKTIRFFQLNQHQIVAFGDDTNRQMSPLHAESEDAANIVDINADLLTQRLNIVAAGAPKPDISWSLMALLTTQFSASPWASSPELNRLLADRFIRWSWSLPLVWMMLGLLSHFNRQVALSSLVGVALLGLFIAGVGAEAANILARKLGASEPIRMLLPLLISSLTAWSIVRFQT
jgi:hypothetical protein